MRQSSADQSCKSYLVWEDTVSYNTEIEGWKKGLLKVFASVHILFYSALD